VEDDETEILEDPLGLGWLDEATLRLRPTRPAARRRSGAVPLKPAAQLDARVASRKAAAGSSAAEARPGARRERERALLSSDAFDPLAYLSTVHRDTPLSKLRAGLEHLQADAGARRGAVAALVRDNFERFISCKTTIDDVLSTLRRSEGGGAAAAAPRRGERAQPHPSGQTAAMEAACAAVQAEAAKVLLPLLQRQAQADGVRAVLALLRRQRSLFSLPARLAAAAQRGDVHAALREWRAARELIGPHEAPLMHALLGCAEREVGLLEARLGAVIAAPGPGTAAAEAAARALLHIQAVREAGAEAVTEGSAQLAARLVAAFALQRAAQLEAAAAAAAAELAAAVGARLALAAARLARAGCEPGDGGAQAHAAAQALRLRAARRLAEAALDSLPDCWRFAAALAPAAPMPAEALQACGRAAEAAAAALAALAAEAARPRPGAAPGSEAAAVRGVAWEAHRLARLLGEGGAPAEAAAPLEAARDALLRRYVADLGARMAAEAGAAAAAASHAPAPIADVAACCAQLAPGLGAAEEEEEEEEGAAAALHLRVSPRPLQLAAALQRGVAALLAAAAEFGGAASAAAAAQRPLFFAAFAGLAEAGAAHAAAAGLLWPAGGPVPDGPAEQWEQAALALAADAAFARALLLPALAQRAQLCWAAGARAAGAAAAEREAAEALAALEEQALAGYVERSRPELALQAAGLFDGGGVDWARCGAPRGVRDGALRLLDALAAAHARCCERAAPLAPRLLSRLAEACAGELAAAGAASEALRRPAPPGCGLCASGAAQLLLELDLLQTALGPALGAPGAAQLGQLREAVLDAATAAAKQAASASGRAAPFSRSATRAALQAEAAAARERLLAWELRRCALHTQCFRGRDAPPPDWLQAQPPTPPPPPPPPPLPPPMPAADEAPVEADVPRRKKKTAEVMPAEPAPAPLPPPAAEAAPRKKKERREGAGAAAAEAVPPPAPVLAVEPPVVDKVRRKKKRPQGELAAQ